jgi:hypothetical protein
LGAENHFRSESRLPSHLFNQTATLATDETQMEHGLGAENCFSRPRFYPSPARNQFGFSTPGFRPFPICVYSVFHPWQIELHSPDTHSPGSIPQTPRFAPLRLSPFALNPRRLETPTGLTAQRFNDSTPRSIRLSSNTAGYSRLFEAICPFSEEKLFASGQKSTAQAVACAVGRDSASRPDFQRCFARF